MESSGKFHMGRHNGWMRGEVGKETLIKEIYNRRIFMTSHMTPSSASEYDKP